MNKIDDIYGAKILKALSKNDQLEELDISVNDLGNSVSSLFNLVYTSSCFFS
jgi:hypothetical protein